MRTETIPRVLAGSQAGFTIVEALVAVTVFAIGVLGVAAMQVKAIHGNQDATARSNAIVIASAFLEEFKNMSFTDPLLSDPNPGGDLNAGRAPAGGQPAPNQAEHSFQAAINLPYQLNANGNLVDPQGREYQVFWNVNDCTVLSGEVAYKVIRLFVYWTGNMGRKSIIITATKYNNVSL